MIGAEVDLWARSGIKKLKKSKINTPVPRLRPDLCECVTSMIFQGLFVFFAWGGWQGSPQLKISLWFFCFRKIFFLKHHGYLWWKRKSFIRSKCITVNFSKKKIFSLKVCSIKPFISGFGPNPIEHWAPTGRPHCLLQPYSCVVPAIER